MLVMRRANGDLFTEVVNGRVRVPLWSSEDAVDRFKVHNPELMVFFAAPLTRSLVEKSRQKYGLDSAVEFFLLSDDAPSAQLDAGEAINIEEVFAELQAA